MWLQLTATWLWLSFFLRKPVAGNNPASILCVRIKCLQVLRYLDPLCFWFCYHTAGFKIQISKTPCHCKSAIHMRLSQTIPSHKATTFLDPGPRKKKRLWYDTPGTKAWLNLRWNQFKIRGYISILNYINMIFTEWSVEMVPFFFIFSFWSMVNGQLHGFSFSTQNSPAVPNTGYNQLNTISQQGYRCSSPRGQKGCCKQY